MNKTTFETITFFRPSKKCYLLIDNGSGYFILDVSKVTFSEESFYSEGNMMKFLHETGKHEVHRIFAQITEDEIHEDTYSVIGVFNRNLIEKRKVFIYNYFVSQKIPAKFTFK